VRCGLAAVYFVCFSEAQTSPVYFVYFSAPQTVAPGIFFEWGIFSIKRLHPILRPGSRERGQTRWAMPFVSWAYFSDVLAFSIDIVTY
jgi:hypothetical protein